MDETVKRKVLQLCKDVTGVPVGPLVGDGVLPIDRLFLDVRMQEDRSPNRQKSHEKDRIHSYKDLLTRDGHRADKIYIRGEPGSGKSCYVLKMIQEWCAVMENSTEEDIKLSDDASVMLEYDFVFYVAFSRLQKDHSTVLNMICDDYLFSDESDEMKTNVREILTSSKYVSLLILDGFDESRMNSVPDNSTLNNCQMLITSRPLKLKQISLV